MGLLSFLGIGGGAKTTVTQTQTSQIDIAFNPQIDLTVEPTPIDLSPLRAIADNFARTTTKGFERLDQTQRDVAAANAAGLLVIAESQAADRAVEREGAILSAMSSEKFRKTLLLIGVGGAVALVAR